MPEETVEVVPAIFRILKESKTIDIWFPTMLSHTRDGVMYVTVFSPHDGHCSGDPNIMHQISLPVKNPDDYKSIKEAYERKHNMVLKPYQRWQKWFTSELYRQHGEYYGRTSNSDIQPE